MAAEISVFSLIPPGANLANKKLTTNRHTIRDIRRKRSEKGPFFIKFHLPYCNCSRFDPWEPNSKLDIFVYHSSA